MFSDLFYYLLVYWWIFLPLLKDIGATVEKKQKNDSLKLEKGGTVASSCTLLFSSTQFLV